MPRTSVVTGSASGIGKATKELLMERGETVIGVDIHDADVVVDLSTAAGRASLVEQVSDLSGGAVDAVLAVAGLASPTATTVAVNYFGTIATLEDLRPLLVGSAAPAPSPSRRWPRSSRRTTSCSPHSSPATKRMPWPAPQSSKRAARSWEP
ncbi:hypothetical protein [Cryobacterium sp. 10C3]|uniref:hypothetical protein n=1 Tax=Cryobacterium sp. 10C3 TaxID=3048577 RepID=UPI002AB3CAE2|nr:hypothetical protein [Cryobacterium sp. 10C3]MDY7556930.1 hypothetical protein [Cryobacterium sp. 10C3]